MPLPLPCCGAPDDDDVEDWRPPACRSLPGTACAAAEGETIVPSDLSEDRRCPSELLLDVEVGGKRCAVTAGEAPEANARLALPLRSEVVGEGMGGEFLFDAVVVVPLGSPKNDGRCGAGALPVVAMWFEVVPEPDAVEMASGDSSHPPPPARSGGAPPNDEVPPEGGSLAGPIVVSSDIGVSLTRKPTVANEAGC